MLRTVAAVLLLMASPATADVAPAQTESLTQATRYKTSGATALRPSQIWDDGSRTYIVWPAEVELPAVFSIGSDGREVLADGAMRDGQYVLDRVHTSLVFRIDRSVAKARRTAARR